MYYVVDWDRSTFGQGHTKVEHAVAEFDALVGSMGDSEHHIGLVEFVFPKNEYGTTLRAHTMRNIKEI